MWLIDQIGWMFANIQSYVVNWVDRIDDNWVEMPRIQHYLESIANSLGNQAMYFFNLSDDYDLSSERAKDAILGVYYDLPSWLDSMEETVTGWTSDFRDRIERRMDNADTWIVNSDEWFMTKLTGSIDSQMNRIRDRMALEAEYILDKMFED